MPIITTSIAGSGIRTSSAAAWAGVIGAWAGATQIDLIPFRRTVATFAAPDGIEVAGWPLVADYTHQLYFAPESRGLLASPMDEDPVEPCDAQPDELVIAQTMDRLETLAPSLVPRSLRLTWAGLRTFAPDQTFVIGEDPSVKGFFWLAGLKRQNQTSALLGLVSRTSWILYWRPIIPSGLISSSCPTR